MGGSASKKENFPGISLTQEQIDKIHNNFIEFSKLSGGKSGDYIGQKGLSKLCRPNKNFGRKVHSFLSDQAVTQTLNFDVFLFFVEFFIQTQNYMRQDVRYREYSIVEMFSVLSLYSNSLKNKLTDKDYILRLTVTYRQGLEFMKEIHSIIGVLSGKKTKEDFLDIEETVPKKITSLIFGESYELIFRNFIERTLTIIPNVEKLIQTYFKNVFFTNEKDKKEAQAKPSNPQEVHHSFSDLLTHNTISNLSLFVNQFTDKSQYRERVFNGQTSNFDYELFGRSISLGNNFNVLLLISHQVEREPLDEESHVIQKSSVRIITEKEQHLFGLYLPKQQVEAASFFQVKPNFSIVQNQGKKKFFNIDQTATVVFFGEGEEDIFFLHNDLTKNSYIKTNNAAFSPIQGEPNFLKINQVEIWVFSDSPIDMKYIRPSISEIIYVEQNKKTTVAQVTPSQENIIVSRTTTTQQQYVASSNSYSSQQQTIIQ